METQEDNGHVFTEVNIGKKHLPSQRAQGLSDLELQSRKSKKRLLWSD